MTDERLLLDTFFIQALLNSRDAYHERAVALFPRVSFAREVIITEAVLLETGNSLSGLGLRASAAQFIRSCYETVNIRVVPMSTSLLLRALALFEARPDKKWSLTDCISFVVMDEFGISLAATGDRHFLQAGFHPLLSED